MSNKNQEPRAKSQDKKIRDSFWTGLLTSLLLPPALLMLFFKIKFTTNATIFDPVLYEAIWRSMERGFLAADMISAMFPSLILFFVFFKMEWWKASRGLVIGTVPYFILLFYFL